MLSEKHAFRLKPCSLRSAMAGFDPAAGRIEGCVCAPALGTRYSRWIVAKPHPGGEGIGRIVRQRGCIFGDAGFLFALGVAGLFPVGAQADYAVLRSGARLHITGYGSDGERHLTVEGEFGRGGYGFGGCGAGGAFRGGALVAG